MNRFQCTATPLAGLIVVERQKLGDHRGFFSRLFCSQDLAAAGWAKSVEQINHTYTQRKGAVRGMHFQNPPHAEMKLVSCIRGEVWDVAVDLRQGSPTFMQWYAQHLSADNCLALLIPEGFAHGFQTLCDDCELLYLHSSAFSPASEGGVSPLDPRLHILWPEPITDLSARDQQHPLLTATYSGVAL